MTHTPDSGPFGLATTPVITPVFPAAVTRIGATASSHAIADAARTAAPMSFTLLGMCPLPGPGCSLPRLLRDNLLDLGTGSNDPVARAQHTPDREPSTVQIMLHLKRELAALRFLDGLGTHLRDVREPQKALRHALRDTREFLEATHGCIAALRAGRPEADLPFTLPKEADWNLDVLTRFIQHAHPPIQPDMLIAPVRRRGGAWGAIALCRPGRPYDRDDGRLLMRIAASLSGAIHRSDRDRMVGVRDRIDRKIMEQIHPKDLFYQILDGLRSLTHYDHSSALLIREEGDTALRLVAEQIAWTKAKSQRIGLRLPITDDAAATLE